MNKCRCQNIMKDDLMTSCQIKICGNIEFPIEKTTRVVSFYLIDRNVIIKRLTLFITENLTQIIIKT